MSPSNQIAHTIYAMQRGQQVIISVKPTIPCVQHIPLHCNYSVNPELTVPTN